MGTLRLLLAFAVVIAHSNPILGFTGMGGSAVPAFFIVSGFYMHLVLDQKYRGRVQQFYFNRALRLFPAYWATILFMFAVSLLAIPATSYFARTGIHNAFGSGEASLAALIPNFFIIGSDALRQFLFDGNWTLWRMGLTENQTLRGGQNFLLVPQIWSVAVEITFYAAAPLIARLRPAPFVVAVIASVFIGRNYFELHWWNVTPMANAAFFMFGMAAYRFKDDINHKALAVIPFALFFLWQPIVDLAGRPLEIWALFALGVPALFRVSTSPLDRSLGDLSYPVYLIHPLFSVGSLADLAAPVAFILSIVVGVFILVFVEKPIRLRKLQGKPIQPTI